MQVALIIDSSYFIAAFLFIYGLKQMSSPRSARAGIVLAGVGMVIAVLASFLYSLDVRPEAKPMLQTNILLALLALSLGLGWAWWSGKKVAMTAMPQLVAAFHSLVGLAAVAVVGVGGVGGVGGGVHGVRRVTSGW